MKTLSPPIIFFAFMACVFLGCARPSVNPQELNSYLNDPSNGLIQVKNHDLISFVASYKPQDLIVFQEVNDNEFTEVQVDSIRSKIKNLDYFTFNISYDNKELANKYGTDADAMNDVVTYLSSEIGNQIRLVHEQDTIPVHDFMYFPSYGMTKASEVLIVFESSLSDKNDKFTFLYNDELFNTGLNKFEFDTQSIKEIPNLIFKK